MYISSSCQYTEKSQIMEPYKLTKNPTTGLPEAEIVIHTAITNDVTDTMDIARSAFAISSPANIQMAFMRKVYGILTSQIILTTAVAAVFLTSESARNFIQDNPGLLFLSVVGTVVSFFALMLNRYETPLNYILLILFTLMEAYTVGFFVTFYTIPSVVEAFLVTTGLFLGLTLYTFQSKRDFSSWLAPALMSLWALIIAMIIQIIFPIPALHLVLSLVGAALFCVFVIIDTHTIMNRLSPDEYILGAINLYLDISNIFLRVLDIKLE